MNVQRAPTAPTPPTKSRERQSSARLHGRWLLFARGTWVALVALTLAIFSASVPVYLTQLQTICTGTYGTAGTDGTGCAYLQLTPEQAAMLKGWGFSPGEYAAYTLALTLAMMAVCLAVSTLITWRRADDRMALLVALMLVTLGPVWMTSSGTPTDSPLQVPNACLYFLLGASFMFVFSLFPTGQFVPRWTRWTAVASLAVQVPTVFFPTAPFALKIHANDIGYLVLLGEVAILVAIQVYRYRRVSGPLRRQQTKWVVVGLAAPGTVYLGGTLLCLIVPALAEPDTLYGAPYQLALNTISNCLLLLLPLSFGFAMLRYRLWDVDVLINRTLVYGALTLILTAVFVGLVIGLQALLGGIGLIGRDNGAAIVLSTLAIAALFQPVRKRLQALIDRRFYRRKYDTAKILEAFSATLRHEMDLDTLREQLLAIAHETMQPAQVSLWLRQPQPEEGGGGTSRSRGQAQPARFVETSVHGY
jgi:hypothetical protein